MTTLGRDHESWVGSEKRKKEGKEGAGAEKISSCPYNFPREKK